MRAPLQCISKVGHEVQLGQRTDIRITENDKKYNNILKLQNGAYISEQMALGAALVIIIGQRFLYQSEDFRAVWDTEGHDAKKYNYHWAREGRQPQS